MLDFTLDKVNEILKQLKGIRIKEAVSLRKRLEKEKQKLVPKQKSILVVASTTSANKIRSTKLTRYWRYVKLIRDNFPDLKTNQIRTQLKKRRQGHETKIPDAIWQNPSG